MQSSEVEIELQVGDEDEILIVARGDVESWTHPLHPSETGVDVTINSVTCYQTTNGKDRGAVVEYGWTIHTSAIEQALIDKYNEAQDGE